MIVFYLCNGDNPSCNKRGCYKKGYECKHTVNPDYAKYYESTIEDPEKSTRFEKEEIRVNGKITDVYYWEHELKECRKSNGQ